MVLQVENITKVYGSNRGATNISFNIDQGEILGLLGPNGSGKTTIMKIITGLTKPTEGTTKIFDHDVVTETSDALKHVGALIEAPASIPYLTASQNLSAVARFYEKPFSIEKILSVVGLSDVKDDKTEKFSLGMKQRLGIAIALIGSPKLLILDEPTNGLDIESTVLMRELFINLAKKGTTILISSHLAAELEKMCTKVAVMRKSELKSIHNMDYIKNNYQDLEEYYIDIVKSTSDDFGGEL